MSINGKKVLITGGAGFIGANFVYKFLELGYSVAVFEKRGVNFRRIEKIRKNIHIYYPNLLDYKETKEIIKKIKPDIVLHFATYGAYQSKQQDIQTTIDTNLLGTINLINSCSKIPFDCFINTGTNSEYGIKEKPMKETDILEPNNLYGITKAAATMYCQNMAKKHNLPIITVRPFAVYGYFEEQERLVPTIIKSCVANNELKLSSPDSVRDFIFIEDLINAYLAIIKNAKKIKGQVFNVGSGKQHTINQVVNIGKKITHSKIKPIYGQVQKAQIEPKIWQADISKAKKMLQWKLKYTLEQGLKKDVEWFKDNLKFYV